MILGTANIMRKKESGFSLIELGIILTIVGLFVATGLQTYKVYSKQSATNTAFERKNYIEIALGKFMAMNGRLPCPADPSLAIGAAGAGVENCRPNNVAYPTLACTANNSLCRIAGARGPIFPATGTTIIGTVPANGAAERVLRGGIPYVTLGISPRDAYDPWGSMMTYAVTEMLASSFFLSQSSTTSNCTESCQAVSEGSTLSLTASAGKIFTSVIYASYGTPVGLCPAVMVTGACHAANSTTAVANAFQGRASGSISASNGVFGDPCSGTVKRLAVILRQCEATAMISFNEANGAIDHRSWDEVAGTDTRLGNPNVRDASNNATFNSWMMAVVSHGPDRKGGWNAFGRMAVPCTGTGRDVVNCTMNSATFINEARVSTVAGADYYDDAFVSSSPIRDSDKWIYSTISAIRNKDSALIGIGKNNPSTSLDVEGAIRSNNAESMVFCDANGNNCFQPGIIGGSGIRCSGGWMKGIANGQAICETKVNTSTIVSGVGNCPSGQYLVGFCANGTRMCKIPGGSEPVCP